MSGFGELRFASTLSTHSGATVVVWLRSLRKRDERVFQDRMQRIVENLRNDYLCDSRARRHCEDQYSRAERFLNVEPLAFAHDAERLSLSGAGFYVELAHYLLELHAEHFFHREDRNDLMYSMIWKWPSLFEQIFCAFVLPGPLPTFVRERMQDFLCRGFVEQDSALKLLSSRHGFRFQFSVPVLTCVMCDIQQVDFPSAFIAKQIADGLVDIVLAHGGLLWNSKNPDVSDAVFAAVCDRRNSRFLQLFLMCQFGMPLAYGTYDIAAFYVCGDVDEFAVIARNLLTLIKRNVYWREDMTALDLRSDWHYLQRLPTRNVNLRLFAFYLKSGDLAVRVLFHLLAVLHDLEVPMYVAEKIVLFTNHAAYAFLGGHAKFIAHAAGVCRSINNVRNARGQPAKRIRLHE
jgi:hypothetical protein